MNRSWIVIAKTENLPDIPPLNRLWYAESNSPDNKPRLSGEPDIREVTEIFLNMLPPTYTKEDALVLVNRAVDNVFKGQTQEKEVTE